MATEPSLPSEIISKIVTFLPVQDVFNCMLVCKLWKEVISSEQFCKSYVLSHYDFEDEEKPSGHLAGWLVPDNWFAYWDENADKSNMFVFSDPPKRWKCGIVHLAKYTLESHKELKYKDFFKAVNILLRIQKAAEELQLDCGACGNESDGVIEVCLFPWSKDTLPTENDVIERFHFNPEMCESPMVSSMRNEDEDDEDNNDDDEDDDEDEVSWKTLRSFHDDKQKAIAFFNWLKKIFKPFIQIVIGCEALNPVPCFILAQIAPGWVGGVLTSLTLT